MKDLQKAWRARNWMKNNEAFLQTWHAYVGNELGLFKSFEKPKTVVEVSNELGVKEDLLQRWVDVGSSINHLRKRTGGRYRTSKKHCGEFLEEEQNGIGALLKEMMELHIMISVITPIDEAEEGQAFSSAFNSFFTAHSNLHPLPSEVDIHDMATSAGLSLTAWDPIVKEGGWYAFWLSPQVEYTIENPEN